MVVGIYVPNEDKSKFLEYFLNELISFTYENWYQLGDWNGVTFLT